MPQPTPPTPLSYPYPHWLITDYAAADMAGSQVVTITSDVQLHLSLAYTPQEPLQSNRQRWRRGMGWVRDKHWSFFPVGLIAQVEAGDTLQHTFYVPWETSTDRLWIQFDHAYAAQYVCPVCGLTELPQLQQLVKQQSRQFIITRFYCSVCNRTFELNGITNRTASKSTTPFFPVLPAATTYDLLVLESWYQILNYETLFIEEFSS
jgi:hypothetical protein